MVTLKKQGKTRYVENSSIKFIKKIQRLIHIYNYIQLHLPVIYCLYQLVHVQSGMPRTRGYMQSSKIELCGSTANTPDGSNAPEPLKTLMRIEGALSSEKLVSNVVGTQEGIRGAHRPLEQSTRDSPRSLYIPRSLQRACNECPCGKSQPTFWEWRTIWQIAFCFYNIQGGTLKVCSWNNVILSFIL